MIEWLFFMVNSFILVEGATLTVVFQCDHELTPEAPLHKVVSLSLLLCPLVFVVYLLLSVPIYPQAVLIRRIAR